MKAGSSISGSVFIALLSCGWVLPLMEAVAEFRAWVERDLYYRLGGGAPVDSFPHLSLASQCLNVAFAWAAIVVFSWVLYYMRLRRPRERDAAQHVGAQD